MAMLRVQAALESLPHLRAFRTRSGLVAETFFRLSSEPLVMGMLPTWKTQLMAAFTLNRQHYMPYCSVCGKEVTFGDMRTWTHTVEAEADHVADQVSHPDSHAAPPKGLRYLVTFERVPLLWVLNDGTIVVPPAPEQERRQAEVVAAIGEQIDPKYL